MGIEKATGRCPAPRAGALSTFTRRLALVFALVSSSMLAAAGAQAASGAEKALAALEAQRLDALAKPDGAALRALLADDYVHVHGTGKVEDREAFIRGIVERPRRSERQDLRYRIYGDTAVITGVQINHTLKPDGTTALSTTYYATQVLRRQGGRWRFVSMQVTPVTGGN